MPLGLDQIDMKTEGKTSARSVLTAAAVSHTWARGRDKPSWVRARAERHDDTGGGVLTVGVGVNSSYKTQRGTAAFYRGTSGHSWRHQALGLLDAGSLLVSFCALVFPQPNGSMWRFACWEPD